jgi:hypothetical protein
VVDIRILFQHPNGKPRHLCISLNYLSQYLRSILVSIASVFTDPAMDTISGFSVIISWINMVLNNKLYLSLIKIWDKYLLKNLLYLHLFI